MRTLLLAASITLLAPTAMAQLVVVGSGAAKSCYQSAKMGNMGSISAIRTCDRALEQRETLVRADLAATHVNRGVLLMRKGESEAAEEDYLAALKLYPDLPEAHINHGVALYYQGRYTESLAAYDRAIELGSEKLALAYFNRALVHERLDDARSAYYDLKRATELKPEWEQAQTAISRFTVTKRST